MCHAITFDIFTQYNFFQLTSMENLRWTCGDKHGKPTHFYIDFAFGLLGDTHFSERPHNNDTPRKIRLNHWTFVSVTFPDDVVMKSAKAWG